LMLFKQFEDNVKSFIHLFIFYTLMPIVFSAYIGLMLAVLSFEVSLMSVLLSDAKNVAEDSNKKNVVVLYAGDERTASEKRMNKICGEMDKDTLDITGGSVEGCIKLLSHKYITDGKMVDTSLPEKKVKTFGSRVFSGISAIKSGAEYVGGKVKDGAKAVGNVAVYTYEFGENVWDNGPTEATKEAIARGVARSIGFQGALTAKHLDWVRAKITEFILYLLVIFITLKMMLDFLRELPAILEKFVAKDFNDSTQTRRMKGDGKQQGMIDRAVKGRGK